MKANEIPNHILREQGVAVIIAERERYTEEKSGLLNEINKSLKHLASRKSIKRSEIYEIKKVTLMEDHHDEEIIKLCEGEIKGIDSGLTQLKKIKALLKSYGL